MSDVLVFASLKGFIGWRFEFVILLFIVRLSIFIAVFKKFAHCPCSVKKILSANLELIPLLFACGA